MAGEQTTFGCGQALPGQGAFNFGDGPPDSPPDGGRVPPIGPPGLNELDCLCVFPELNEITVSLGNEVNGVQQALVTIQLICKDCTGGGCSNPNGCAKVMDWINTQYTKTGWGEWYPITPCTEPGGDCLVPWSCTGPCDLVEFTIERIEDDPPGDDWHVCKKDLDDTFHCMPVIGRPGPDAWPSLASCLANATCGPYKCISDDCVDTLNPNDWSWFSKEACIRDGCENWECVNGNCVSQNKGQYKTYAECFDANCIKYDCDGKGNCVPTSNGRYDNFECKDAYGNPDDCISWYCDSGIGQCKQGPGPYTSQSECIAAGCESECPAWYGMCYRVPSTGELTCEAIRKFLGFLGQTWSPNQATNCGGMICGPGIPDTNPCNDDNFNFAICKDDVTGAARVGCGIKGAINPDYHWWQVYQMLVGAGYNWDEILDKFGIQTCFNADGDCSTKQYKCAANCIPETGEAGGGPGVGGKERVIGSGNTGRQGVLGEPKITGRSRLPKIKNILKAGAALISAKSTSRRERLSAARQSKTVNLNDSNIQDYFRKKRPTGLVDSNIAIFTKPVAAMVPNTSGYTQWFGTKIDHNINYILKNNRNKGDWDSSRVEGVSVRAVIKSLKPSVLSLLKSMRNYDGSLFNEQDIYAIIGTRIIDGTLGKLQLKDLQKIAKESHKRVSVDIVRGSSNDINEYAALSIIENTYFSLDPSKSEGRMRKVLPNWKVLSTDIDKHLTITFGRNSYKFYIKDDDTFITGSTLAISDGDYLKFVRKGKDYKIFCESEKDHAFIISDSTRQRSVKLIGGDENRTVTVTADASSGIEFDYSLSTPRQNFYILSCVLSSITTQPITQYPMLKATTATYQLMDSSSVSDINIINDYIRYKANNRTMLLANDDLMLDYITQTRELKVRQQEIIPNTPKTNKTTPLLLRQVPWYMVVIPTNRAENLLFNATSQIISYDPSGKIIRELKVLPINTPLINKKQSISTRLGYPTYSNVYGEEDTQTRISALNSNNAIFKNTYRVRGVEGTAEDLSPTRQKTGFRQISEIIQEIDKDYVTGIQGIGKTITDFDLFSRFSLTPFNKFVLLENKTLLYNLIQNGLVNDIKVFPPLRKSDGQLTIKKTQLLQKREAATTPQYPVIKAMETGYIIEPPSSTERDNPSSSFGPTPTR